MSEVNNTRILKDILRKISIESVLTESEAFEVITSAMIYPEWLDFFAPKIIELANNGERIGIIKIECCLLMSLISLVGGLENYKRLKGLA